MSTFGALLLAGGRASRLDGAAKPLLEVGGITLLDRAIAAVTDAGAAPIVVVGPGPVERARDAAVEWVREDPPFGGPAAAVVAGLAADRTGGADPEWTFVLACDLPRVDAVVARLVADIPLLPAETDGICLADPSGRPQWLSGAYRTGSLRSAASALPDHGRDAPVRLLLDDFAIAVITVDAAIVEDVDTWDDLDRARARALSEEDE